VNIYLKLSNNEMILSPFASL